MAIDFSGKSVPLAAHQPIEPQQGHEGAPGGLPVEAQALLSAFDNSATVGIGVLNRHHRLVHVSQTFARTLGYAPDRMIGERLAAFLDAASVDEARETLNAVMRGETGRVAQWSMLAANAGGSLPLQVETWCIDGRFGQPYLLLLAQTAAPARPAEPAERSEEEAQPLPADVTPLDRAPNRPEPVPQRDDIPNAELHGIIRDAHAAIGKLKSQADTSRQLADARDREAKLAFGREKLLHAILRALPETVFVLDKTGRISAVWSAETDIAGIPLARVHGMHIGQFFTPADTLRIKEALRATRTKRPAGTLTAQLGGRHGALRKPTVELRLADLQPSGIVATLRDVTVQHRSREKLARQVEHLDDMRRSFVDRGRQLTRLADRLNREKRRSDRVKATRTHFLATVSHEFRTPLNAILGFAEILNSELLGPLGNPRYRRYARDIVESGNLLVSLVDTVLSYEQAATDRLNLEPDRIDIRALVGEVLALFGRWAGGLGIAINVEHAPQEPVLYADAKALRQMLANLVSNAVKFSDSGSTVLIRVEPGPGGKGTVISVQDRGIGMNAEDIELSMRPFGQVAEHPSGGRSGIGIGLPLTRHLIQEHGGKLVIDSQPGGGTTVSLHFPPSSTILPAKAAQERP